MTRRRAAAAFLLAGCVLLSACGNTQLRAPEPASSPAQTQRGDPSPQTSRAPTPATASATPTTKSLTQIRAEVDAKLTRISAGQPAQAISVAAVNTQTGVRYTFGATKGMWTASVYKLLVLEALLLQHQRNGTSLSSYEMAAAKRMIENSDNTAGYQLFLAAGGRSGLAEAAERLGMRHTVIGRSDPTFTTTSARACLKMLEALIGPGPLDAHSRSYALELMRNVQADQRWGVSVIADPHTRFAIKNGWLPVENGNGPGANDDGRWVANSAGIVTVGSEQVLMVVMTQHQPSFDAGVALVQRLARVVAPVVE